MRFFFSLFLFFSISNLYAQSYYTERDSIHDAEIMAAFFYKTKFQVVLSHEKTLLKSGVNIKMNLVKVGFQLKKDYKFGLLFGISKTYDTFNPEVRGVSRYETNITTFGGYFEYVFIENYRYYVGFPVSVGRGKVLGRAINIEGEEVSQHNWESNNFGVFSLGANGGVNVNHWLTLAAGVGYRFTSSENAEARNLLSTPFYTYGLKFKFGHFLTSVFHQKRVKKMKSIYFRDKDNWLANHFKNKHPEFYK